MKIIFFLRFFAFCFLLFALFYLSQNNFFKIKKISCQTQYGPCSQRDDELIASFLGKNFFFLANSQVESTLLQNPTTNKVFVQKVFPDTLEIKLEKRKLLVSISKEEFLSRGVFLLAGDGVISEFVKNSSLPLLVIPQGSEDLSVGMEVEEKIQKAAMALSLLYSSQKVARATFVDNFLSFELPGGVLVYFPLEKDTDALIGALQLLVTRSRIEGNLPKTIDLRYSNPVLKY